MKPFDLAKLGAGNAVITREGAEVKVLLTDAGGKYPIIAAYARFMDGERGWRAETYSLEGRANTSYICDTDLFMKPVKKVGWVNLYRVTRNKTFGDVHTAHYVHRSEQEALEAAVDSSCLATVEIKWEE